jgi:type IV secretion system protein VirB11
MRPILPFLEDDLVHDVMLNADGSIWVDKAGQGMFRTEAAIRPGPAETMLKTIAAVGRRELGPSQPSLQAELPAWGGLFRGVLRVQGLIPPIVAAPIFALRKPAALAFPLEHYSERAILPEKAPPIVSAQQGSAWARGWKSTTPSYATLLDRLRLAVAQRANILVSGGTGTGKTTFANALLREISTTADRVFIVEDTRELQCTAKNQVSVRVTDRAYSWQNAIADAMRLRPDRIVVGEVRDAAALDLLKAWNTGHPGGIATVHANDAPGALERICQLVEEVLPVAPRRFIADAINVVVQLERDARHPAGRRLSAAALVEGVSTDGTWILSPL